VLAEELEAVVVRRLRGMRKKKQHFILVLFRDLSVCFWVCLGGESGKKVRKGGGYVRGGGEYGGVDVCVLVYVRMLRGLRGLVVK